MDETTNFTSFCAVYEAIQLLQEKWNLHIIRALLRGPLGFNELGRATGGCNPATLAQRLDRLEELELVTRTVEQVMPPRTSYRLTESGLELQGVITAIDCWASRRITTKLPAPHHRSAACAEAEGDRGSLRLAEERAASA